jgi:uncharacterized protein YkwD
MNPFVRNFTVVGLTAAGVALSATFWPGGVPSSTPQGPREEGGSVLANPNSGCNVAGPIANADVSQMINNFRASQGLPVIPVDTLQTVLSVAQARVGDMASFGYVGTINTLGQDISTELKADGLAFFVAGLDVFKGCLGSSPDNMVALNDWLANPSTAAAINNPNWTSMSFGETAIVTDLSTGVGYYLIAVVFVEQ